MATPAPESGSRLSNAYSEMYSEVIAAHQTCLSYLKGILHAHLAFHTSLEIAAAGVDSSVSPCFDSQQKLVAEFRRLFPFAHLQDVFQALTNSMRSYMVMASGGSQMIQGAESKFHRDMAAFRGRRTEDLEAQFSQDEFQCYTNFLRAFIAERIENSLQSFAGIREILGAIDPRIKTPEIRPDTVACVDRVRRALDEAVIPPWRTEAAAASDQSFEADSRAADHKVRRDHSRSICRGRGGKTVSSGREATSVIRFDEDSDEDTD
jgi:hypothetical protein